MVTRPFVQPGRLVTAALVSLMLAGCGSGQTTNPNPPAPPPPPPPPPPPAAPTIALSSPAIELKGVGTTGTLTATITPNAATVTWTVDKPAVATVAGNGVNATITAVRAGTAQITATATNGGQSASANTTITVVPGIRAVGIDPAQDTIAIGGTRSFTASVEADSGAAVDVIWRSSAPTVATIGSGGTATALAAGTTTITVLSTADTTKRASATLVVRSGPTFPLSWNETDDGIIGGPASPTFNEYTSRPDGLVYAVGNAGVLASRTPGGAWTTIATPVSTDLTRISAPSNDSAWAAGADGVILARRGDSWVVEPTGITDPILSLAMRANGTGFALARSTGNPSIVLERSGGVWSPITVPAASAFSRVGNLSVAGNTVYAYASTNAGAPGGTLFRRTGTTWSTTSGATSTPNGSTVLALSDTDALVAGEAPIGTASIWRVSNTTWQREWVSPVPNTANFANRFIRCTDGSIMAGTSHRVTVFRTGTSWTEHQALAFPGIGRGAGVPLTCRSSSDWDYENGRVVGSTVTVESFRLGNGSARVSAGPSRAFITGSNTNRALVWDGVIWKPLFIPSSSFNLNFGPSFAVTGPNSARAIATEWVGTWNGAAWSWTTLSIPGRAMWASGPNDVWAVGSRGSGIPSIPAIHRYTGSWQPQVPSALDITVSNVHGAGPGFIFANTPRTMLRSTSAGILEDQVEQRGSSTLADVVAFSATSAIVVGTSGYVARYDGERWARLASPTAENFVSVTGRSPTEVYAFTDQGKLYGFDGTDWALIRTFSRPVRHARLAGNLIIGAGDDGLIVYGRPLQ